MLNNFLYTRHWLSYKHKYIAVKTNKVVTPKFTFTINACIRSQHFPSSPSDGHNFRCSLSIVECFLIECCKPKTKVITAANQKERKVSLRDNENLK